MKRINWGAVIFLFILITAPAVGLFALEFFQREGGAAVLAWAAASPNVVLVSYSILFFLFLLLYGVFGCTYITLGVYSAVVLLLGLVNMYKLQFLGEPFYPWDIVFYKLVIELLPLLTKETGVLPLIILFVGLLLFVGIRFVLPKFKLKLRYRAPLALLSLAIIASVAFYQATPASAVLKSLDIQNIVWRQDRNYDINGFLLSYLMNTQTIFISTPEGYNQTNVAKLVDELKNMQPADVPAFAQSNTKPNIIIVMNEAFWDPTLLSSVTFSEDPLPTVRRLQTEHASSWLLSPAIGGYTCNVEFEALTGFSNAFLPTGAVPYQQYINKPIPSMASVLQKRGYYPVAIHPFHKWFWNREKVYQHFGFEKFIGLEDFKNAPNRGAYKADTAVSQKIIEQVNESEKPVFIYAVTMQNHGPYEANRYQSVDIEINGSMSDESLAALRTYTQGVKDGDSALKELIDYFESSAEPTMIVFFGDHLPYLGDDYLAYKEAGFIKAANGELSLPEYQRMRSTPLVVWSNFKEGKQDLNTVSPAFLPPYVFKYAGLELPAYYQFLAKFSGKVPGFSAEIKIDANGNLYHKLPKEYVDLQNKYWLLQYDIMFGKQYSLELGVIS